VKPSTKNFYLSYLGGAIRVIRRLFARDPTSAFSGFRCNRSEVFALSATLLLLTQNLVVLHRPVESTTHCGHSE
jgi:hypothetical protein